MSIVNVEQFNQYTNNYEDDPQHLKEMYLNAAEKVVCNYLGYDPRVREYDEFFSGIGDYKLYLNARDITNVGFVSVKGQPIDVSTLDYKENYIFNRCRQKVFTLGLDNIHVVYTAGFSEMPELIVLTIMRIAALMMEEANGNIGITSKSFADSSRTFINYQNYDKYLKPLDVYRVVRFNG